MGFDLRQRINGRPLLVGHRGAMGVAPENTMVAFAAGLAVDALCPATDFLTQDEVRLIQAAGYACSPGGLWWDYPTLLAWGVDSISSNNPAAVRWEELLPSGRDGTQGN